KRESRPSLLKGQRRAEKSCPMEKGESSPRGTRICLAKPPQRAHNSKREVPEVFQPVQWAQRVALQEVQRQPARTAWCLLHLKSIRQALYHDSSPIDLRRASHTDPFVVAHYLQIGIFDQCPDAPRILSIR